jgi:hypothetical protein
MPPPANLSIAPMIHIRTSKNKQAGHVGHLCIRGQNFDASSRVTVIPQGAATATVKKRGTDFLHVKLENVDIGAITEVNTGEETGQISITITNDNNLTSAPVTVDLIFDDNILLPGSYSWLRSLWGR